MLTLDVTDGIPEGIELCDTEEDADPADYAHATALEALWGYLYMTGQTDRLDELMQRALAETEEVWEKQH